jgi:negative regulator of sigma-B (phosphoserine phosphatase)
MGTMTFRMTISSYEAVDFGVAGRALPGQSTSGDLHTVIPRPRGAIVAVADGLGHGYEAAIAAKVAINTLTAHADLPLLDAVRCCHEALISTRGVAICVACLMWSDETLTWLSIGNVAALLLRADDRGSIQREHVLMRNGVVGHRLPPLRSATHPIRRSDLLILATDGVREGFEKGVRFAAPPQEIADHILAGYGKITDDALVLVARWNGPPASRAQSDGDVADCG